jgi:spore germination protein YaaH
MNIDIFVSIVVPMTTCAYFLLLQIGQVINRPRTQPGNGTYVIQAGDTFYKLAQQWGTTVAAIQAANPGVDPTKLQVGTMVMSAWKETSRVVGYHCGI